MGRAVEVAKNVKVEIKDDPQAQVGKTPSYLTEFISKWVRWTGISGSETEEAIRDLSGDLWTVIRKCESRTYGHIDGCTDMDDAVKESLKVTIKTFMREMWRDIIEKEKIGFDKLGLLTAQYLDKDKLPKQNNGKEEK